jgi:hypothetical protein
MWVRPGPRCRSESIGLTLSELCDRESGCRQRMIWSGVWGGDCTRRRRDFEKISSYNKAASVEGRRSVVTVHRSHQCGLEFVASSFVSYGQYGLNVRSSDRGMAEMMFGWLGSLSCLLFECLSGEMRRLTSGGGVWTFCGALQPTRSIALIAAFVATFIGNRLGKR